MDIRKISICGYVCARISSIEHISRAHMFALAHFSRVSVVCVICCIVYECVCWYCMTFLLESIIMPVLCTLVEEKPLCFTAVLYSSFLVGQKLNQLTISYKLIVSKSVPPQQNHPKLETDFDIRWRITIETKLRINNHHRHTL